MRTVRSSIVVLVSLTLAGVKPPDFSREPLILLARRLNKDFAKEERLSVILFSDFEAARRLDPTHKGDVELMRGSYQLDRPTGKEELEIFVDPKDPQRNIKIDLTRSHHQNDPK